MKKHLKLFNERLARIEAFLVAQKENHISSDNNINSDKPLSVKEAAAFLNLSVPTIYGKVSRGELPYMKRSKRLYFSPTELLDYLKQGRRMTNAEIEEQALSHLRTPKN
jgi:excisionase family DNA binding protein